MSGPLSFSRCTQITVPNIDTINFVFLGKEKRHEFRYRTYLNRSTLDHVRKQEIRVTHSI